MAVCVLLLGLGAGTGTVASALATGCFQLSVAAAPDPQGRPALIATLPASLSGAALRPDTVTLSQQGRPVPVESVQRLDPARTDVAVVLDTAAAPRSVLRTARDVAGGVLSGLPGATRVAVVSGAGDARLLSPLAAARGPGERAIQGAPGQPGHALVDGLAAAADLLTQGAARFPHVVLVAADRDDASVHDAGTVLSTLAEKRVFLSVVDVGRHKAMPSTGDQCPATVDSGRGGAAGRLVAHRIASRARIVAPTADLGRPMEVRVRSGGVDVRARLEPSAWTDAGTTGGRPAAKAGMSALPAAIGACLGGVALLGGLMYVAHRTRSQRGHATTGPGRPRRTTGLLASRRPRRARHGRPKRERAPAPPRAPAPATQLPGTQLSGTQLSGTEPADTNLPATSVAPDAPAAGAVATAPSEDRAAPAQPAVPPPRQGGAPPTSAAEAAMNRQPTQTVSGRPSETERPDSADQLAGGDMQDDTQVVSVGEEAPAAWQLREIVPVADLEVDPGDALLVESPSEWRLEGWLARFCLLLLLPLAAGLRVLTGRGLPPSDPSPTTWLMLLAAAGLTAFGGWWLWVVTAPPYPLTWRGRSARRAALAEQREQVALVDEIAARAAAGESPATAWHEVARGSPTLPNGLPSGIGSAEDLADLSARLHEDLLAQERGPHGGPRVAAVLPFVACLLPAALLILLA